MNAPRYDFEFISSYDGQADYRLFVDGKPDTRITVKDRKLRYIDGSPVLRAEVAAFNDYKRREHARAVAKHGADMIGRFREYVA